MTMYADKFRTTSLDCGHAPSEHGPHTTGYGTDKAGARHCWDCCTAMDRAAMLIEPRVTGYVSCDGKTFTNWPGRALGRVTHWGHKHPFSRTRRYVRVVDDHGQTWTGVGENSMWCSLRKTSSQKSRSVRSAARLRLS